MHSTATATQPLPDEFSDSGFVVTHSHSSQDQRCRRICAEAHLRFLGVMPAFRNQEAPCLFRAALTEGSSLAVPVNELSIGSIKQTLVDWAV
jgi:hypothetical protein